VTDQTEAATSAPAEGFSAGVTTPSSGGFDLAQLAHDRPELVIGAAFAGGFLLAMILKRFAR
jgi:hypothetical protein